MAVRRIPWIALVATVLTGACASAPAQQRTAETTRAQQVASRPADGIGTGHYDVVLEVPELTVDSLILRVEGLRALLSVDAQVVNLVHVTAGAEVNIAEVDLEIAGVVAEAYVYIDLDNVARIIDRVIATLERNPEIITALLAAVDRTVGAVGGITDAALAPGGAVDRTVGAVGRTLEAATRPGGLLSQTVNTLGQTVETTLTATGSIVERTLDTAGSLVGERTVGSVLGLEVVRETAGAAGAVVRQVRDPAGNIIEFTLDAAGSVSAARVLQRAGGR
jgi:hypothetical protein